MSPTLILPRPPQRTGEEKIVLGLSTAMGRPEHHEYRWLSFAVARRLLVPRLRAVLDWATEHLNTGQDGPGAALPR